MPSGTCDALRLTNSMTGKAYLAARLYQSKDHALDELRITVVRKPIVK